MVLCALSTLVRGPASAHVSFPFPRYDTLAATRTELATRQDHDLHALEEARRALMQLTEEKSKALMGLNNQLAELWVRYDQTRMRDFQWETSLSHMKVKAAEKSKEVGAVSPTEIHFLVKARNKQTRS